MGALDAIQPFSTVRPEPRSNLDLVPSQPPAMPTPSVLREMRMNHDLPAGDAASVSPASAAPLTPAALSQASTPPTASTLDIAMREAEPRVPTPRLTPPRDAAATMTILDRTQKVEKQAAIETSKPPKPAALPYGPDPERINHLINWFVSRNEFLPVTFAYRQAGDLRETVPARTPAKSVVSASAASKLYHSD